MSRQAREESNQDGQQLSEKLKESEAKFRQIFNSTYDAIFVTDLQGRFLEVNDGACQQLGYTKEELLRMGPMEITPPEIAAHIPEKMIGTKEKGHLIFESVHLAKDRSQIPVELSTRMISYQGMPAILGVARDITERKRVEDALEESEEKYRLLHDTMLQGVVYQDAEGKIISMNPVAGRMLGKSPNDFIGSSSVGQESFCIHEDGSLFPGNEHPAMVALRTGKEVEKIPMGVWNPRSQKYRWISIDAIPLFKPGEDKPYQVYTLFDDITERRRAEEALKESEAKYHGLFDSMTEYLQVLEPVYDENGKPVDYILIDVNPAWERLTGMKREEVVGHRAKELFGVVEDSWLEAFDTVMKTGKPMQFENYGAALDKYYSVSVWKTGENQVAFTAMDITEIKRAQKAIEEERTRLQTIINGAKKSHLVYLDRDFNFIRVNDAYAETCGYAAEEMIGKNHFALYPNEENEAIFKRVVKTGRPVEIHDKPFEFPDQPERGTTYWDWTLEPVIDDEGEVEGLIFSLVETTDRKRAEEDLIRSNAELQQFAYIASHDLKEPIRMVSSYLGLLERKYKGKVLDEGAEEYLNFALQGAERMNELVNDLLDYSRVETRGKDFAQVSMNHVSEKVIDLLKVPINESEAEIVVEPLPTIEADEGQMIQLLQNLLSNAIKFRSEERPKIHISGTRLGRFWQFAVEDNGIGLDMEFADKIFQMFQRLHTTEEYEGTGIGLAIAKKIVERHGGRIWVESEEGKGSTFFFTIPK